MPIIELDKPVLPDAAADLRVTDRNPFAETGPAGARGGANNCGAFSLQTFCSAGGLSHTHEDAGGFLAYLEKFNPRNFWYQDAGVRAWAYYPPYDDWQDTYGVDAVKACYHSGHGGMGADGTFYAPMGADWGGLGCTAASNKMHFGSAHVRYLFWSTCSSLRVHDGQSPMRTWQQVSEGLRMIFGFETVSWDSGDYGKNFWEEWNKSKSLSSAWLDASWRIAHDQGPSVMAFGATASEAQNRVFNERLLFDGTVSNSWGWWRWYDAARSGRQLVQMMPGSVELATLVPVEAEAGRDMAERLGVSAALTRVGGRMMARDGARSLAREPDGSLTARLEMPNLDNTRALAAANARKIAEAQIRDRGLADNVDLVFDRVLTASAAGATYEGSGRFEAPRVTETLVQFRQVINGLPVVTPGRGLVRVAVDNDGQPTELHSAVREVDTVRSAPEGGTMPPEPEAAMAASPRSADPLEQALDAATSNRLRGVLAAGGSIAGVMTLPGTTEIGYDISGDVARVVAHKAIEVDFGNGYKKRYWVTTPLGV